MKKILDLDCGNRKRKGTNIFYIYPFTNAGIISDLNTFHGLQNPFLNMFQLKYFASKGSNYYPYHVIGISKKRYFDFSKLVDRENERTNIDDITLWIKLFSIIFSKKKIYLENILGRN